MLTYNTNSKTGPVCGGRAFIYNLQGREVVSLVNGNMDAGYHSVVWNADSYSSGVYFVKMMAGEYISTQKLMLIK